MENELPISRIRLLRIIGSAAVVVFLLLYNNKSEVLLVAVGKAKLMFYPSKFPCKQDWVSHEYENESTYPVQPHRLSALFDL